MLFVKNPHFPVKDLIPYAPKEKGKEEKADKIAELPKEKTKGKPEYSTPYLEIMEEVIERLKITKENQPVIKIIESEIEKVAIEKKLSPGVQKINAMASFLRLPESQKGGLKKYKRV